MVSVRRMRYASRNSSEQPLLNSAMTAQVLCRWEAFSGTKSGTILDALPGMFKREANVTHDVSFGHTLKQRRKVLDLTREELAERVGCAVETLRKIETDARRPSRQMAERLADALALAPEERAAFVHLGRSSPAAVSLWANSPTATQIAAPSLSRSLPPAPARGCFAQMCVCSR